MSDIKVVTICGSMRYAGEMMRIAEDLELTKGYAVIQCAYNVDGNKREGSKAALLGKVHLRKIDISDAIYVVNIDGYIGDSTKREIAYALEHGKEIIYHAKIHHMKLDVRPFEMIDREEKQIEYRLNDEKRQLLKIGDIITFSKLPDENETLSVVVTDLKRYETLLAMYEDSFDQYLHKHYSNARQVVDGTSYYSQDQVEEYGCLAIHIKKING